MMHRGLVPLLLACLASCASAPIRYYTLTPSAGAESRPSVGNGAATGNGAEAGKIEITAVRMPMQAERTELMVRQGDDELVLLENEHWASLPSSEIRDALLISLRTALAGADSIHAVSTVNLSIEVERFDASLGRYADIEATWRAKLGNGSGGPILLTCRFKSSAPIGGTYQAMVAGYRHDVAVLADDIAASLTASALATGARCPGDANR